ncbi:hypothetical protein AOQ84DRAFT_355336 [Glonium stellatum]|uniref:Uncharacterized protein n=1 Tax=Glonium stellatum TaxID=574774 RepID=A0A8E2EXI5_9PEZI|nr:hypothetical protein AOQ84DRAFT_355336 [Glonium stellatum]
MKAKVSLFLLCFGGCSLPLHIVPPAPLHPFFELRPLSACPSVQPQCLKLSSAFKVKIFFRGC